MTTTLSFRSFLSTMLLVWAVTLSATSESSAFTRKVLFIGNSYIFTNNMPSLLDSLVRASGDTMVYDESVIGGYTLNQHSTNATTIAKIFSQRWDIVILQEQSQMPSFPPGQVATDVYPYAARLDSMIKANDTCSQTMFLMTWGRANGDASNCPSYPPLCTYGGMQKRLRESYMQMTLDNHALVAPVGMAFKVFKDSSYAPLLYSPDSSHPSLAGSYLEAAVLFGSIFHKPVLHNSFVSTLTGTEAFRLQRIADKVVFDSLALWQQNSPYPYAGFTFTTSGGTVNFMNTSPTTGRHNWQFGDAHSDTAGNPAHHYTATGSYMVTHTISNDCFTETLTDSVTVSTTGLEPANTDPTSYIWTVEGSRFMISAIKPARLTIYDAVGHVVAQRTIDPTETVEIPVSGFYVFAIRSFDGAIIKRGSFVTH